VGKSGEREQTGGEPMRTSASELVAILSDEGVSHLFVNPGMHTAALRDALAAAEAAGVPHPQAVLCVHEHIAVCAAHGHHLAGGGPQAVMAHVESGQLNVSGALGNAQRNRVPTVLFFGDGAESRPQLAEPGGRPRSTATSMSAGGIGKWAVDLSHDRDVGTLVRRAFQVAKTDPAGLAHVALPIERLRQPAGSASRRLPPPRLPAPDMSALEDVAELLASAEWPLIIAGRVGRHLESVHHLARLAEALGAPVIDVRNHVNLPPGHPLNAGLDGQELFDRADAVLLLDVETPCIPALGPPPPQAWLLQIDTDCLKADLPDWTLPIEVAVTADTQFALPPLLALLNDRLAGRQRRLHDRRKRVEKELRAVRESWRDRATSASTPDRSDAILAELQRCLPEDTVIVEEVIPGIRGPLRQLERPPGHLFRTNAQPSGWALGAALGARLARPNQPVVAICDETAFVSGLPTAAFWSAHRGGAPFLTIVLDQGRLRAPRPTREPQLDVMSVARESGAEAMVVERVSAVAAAVERLLATTRDGDCAVLDVPLPVGAAEEPYVRPSRKRAGLTSGSTVTKRQPA
jgi:acetolactate synthase-1/2/3 large subunit